MLKTPSVAEYLTGLNKVQTTTLGHLISFMHTFNLRFGVAKTPEQGQVYDQLYPILVAVRDQAQAPSANPYTTSSGPQDPKAFGNYFSGMQYDAKHGVVPRPRLRPRSLDEQHAAARDRRRVSEKPQGGRGGLDSLRPGLAPAVYGPQLSRSILSSPCCELSAGPMTAGESVFDLNEAWAIPNGPRGAGRIRARRGRRSREGRGTRMKPAYPMIGVAFLAACLGVQAQEQSKPEQARPAAQADRRDDERAIGALVEAFTRAFNAGDAAAIAATFTQGALVVDENGERTIGRAAIRDQFAASFKENPGSTIALEVSSLRFLGQETALEEGRATITPAKGAGAPEVSGFIAIYVKEDGHWLQAAVRDEPASNLTPHDRLKELEWLVGEWVNESQDAVVFTTCKWADNGNFLVREFTVQMQGKPVMSGSQRIGWDPVKRQFKSWVFDSQGGFVEAYWTRDGNQWLVKAEGVGQDGEPATATNIITRLGKDRVELAVRQPHARRRSGARRRRVHPGAQAARDRQVIHSRFISSRTSLSDKEPFMKGTLWKLALASSLASLALPPATFAGRGGGAVVVDMAVAATAVAAAMAAGSRGGGGYGGGGTAVAAAMAAAEPRWRWRWW